jgi:hypothetical protein
VALDGDYLILLGESGKLYSYNMLNKRFNEIVVEAKFIDLIGDGYGMSLVLSEDGLLYTLNYNINENNIISKRIGVFIKEILTYTEGTVLLLGNDNSLEMYKFSSKILLNIKDSENLL